MSVTSLLLILLGAWGSMNVPGSWVSLGGESGLPAEITVLESDWDHALIRIDIPGYFAENLQGYTRFHIPGTGWNTGTAPGQPEFPMISFMVGLPAGTEPELTVEDTQWHGAGYGTVYPAQPPRLDCEDGPFYFVDLSSDIEGVHPQAQAELFQKGVWAGVSTVVLQVNPFRWDADTGAFSVASSMVARVDFTGAGGFQPSVRPEIAAMHRTAIVNYEELGVPVDNTPITSDDVVYVVIVPPDNLETITPFLAAVNSLGHHVHIIVTEEGTGSIAIKSSINEVYQEGVTRFALIPARHQQIESKDFGNFIGDFYYECLDNDVYPDIAVGRFPGDSTQLENQYSKVIAYNEYVGVPGEPSLPASVILAAHEENYPAKYTANSNAVANWSYQLADPVFETCYPPEGGTSEQVQEAINEGVGIVNYRGHGSITQWQWSPGWNAGKIYECTNTWYPPAFNVACSNGAHGLIYNCLCESWMDAPAIGASGTLGASTSSFTSANDIFQTQLFKEIFDNGNTCAGEMFAASQTHIITQMPSLGLTNARMYHWFGDPSMDIYNSDEPGTPFELSVDAPAYVNPGANSLTITVTSEGTPVEGVVVTVTDGIGNHPDHTETFYVQDVTSASGTVTLDFTAVAESDLYYGARMHNYSSVTGNIEVYAQGIEGGTETAVSLSGVSPTPASSSASLSFTAPAGTPVTVTVMDLSGRTVARVHDAPALQGVNAVGIDASSLAPGIYFVRMDAMGSSMTRKMAVVR